MLNLSNKIGVGAFQEAQQGALLNQLYLAYKARVEADGGSLEDNTKSNYLFKQFASLMPDTELLWASVGGDKLRTSGVTKYYTKAYDFNNTNDLTQTTEASQPYQSGNIAPNEYPAMKNPNGGSRYMTHPTISFAANEAWSVTTVVDWNGDNNSSIFNFICGSGSSGQFLGVKALTENKYYVAGSTFTSSTNNLLGKISVISFIKSENTLSVYKDGVLVESKSNSTAYNFNLLNGGYLLTNTLKGSILYHAIRSKALTPTEVANEAAVLQTIYPEIPSVQIGSQTWATSNCEMVATPMGNTIANVTDNTAWSNSQSTYDSVYAATSGTAEQKTYAAVKAAAMWCYYNNDSALGAIYGKLYNWFAVKLLQMDIDYYNTANPSTPWGWRVPTQADFNTLATTLGGTSVAGGKMKVAGTDYWNSPNTGADNSSGFSVIGGGVRVTSGGFVFNKNSSYLSTIDKYWIYTDINVTSITIANASANTPWGMSLRFIKS